MSVTENLNAVTLYRGTYRSHSLDCHQPYAYLIPDGVDESGNASFPLLVLLHGRRCGYLDWTDRTRIARYAASYRMIIAFPDGGNGWYTNAVSASDEQAGSREDDIIQDFLPHLQRTLPIVEPGAGWGIGGFSMGGYGAVKLALKHPKLFSLAFSHSGAFDVTSIPMTSSIFGDREQNATFRRSESVYWLAEQALCRFPLERPRLLIDCGFSDELIGASRNFHQHLHFVGYQHRYAEMPGHHTWPYWDRAVRTILPDVAAMLGTSVR